MAAPGAPNPGSDTSALRRLFERQPASLIRVRLDGVLLACNRASLGFLGAAARRAVVRTNLIDRIPAAQRARWQDFVGRCWEQGAASLECDLIARDNEARPVLVHGVALKDHPDGFESLLLHVAVAARSTDGERRDARFAELERKLEESQLTSLRKQREYGRDVAMLKSALAAAVAAKTSALSDKQELEAVKLRLQAATGELERLQALVAEHEADRRRTAAAHRAALDTLEQSMASKDAALAESRSHLSRTSAEQGSLTDRFAAAQRELDRLREEHRRGVVDLEAATGVVADLRDQLSHASEEHVRLTAQVEQHAREQGRLHALVADHEIDRTRTAANHQAAIDALERSLARAQGEVQTRDAALAEVRSELARTSAEQGRLAERVALAERELDLQRAEHERAQEHLIVEHRQALADVETGNRETLDELRSQQSQALAEHRRLVARIEEHELERDRLIAEHRRALANMETVKDEALADLRSQLSQAVAEHRRLIARADEQQLELDRVRAEHSAALTDMETRHREIVTELRGELAQAAAEQTRALECAAEYERERGRMSAEHSLAIADLQASKDAAVTELRAQLSAAEAEHHRLGALLETWERERERLAAEHRRALADLQSKQQETVADCERILLDVQRALLVRDASRRVEVERRLVDRIDERPITKADGERLAALQRGFSHAFSRVRAVLQDGPALKKAAEAERAALERPAIPPIDNAPTAPAAGERPVDGELLRETPFDNADDAFVQQLLGGTVTTPRPENVAESNPVAPAQPASGIDAAAADDLSADAVFDDQDAAFVSCLMSTNGPPQQPVEEADADAAPELPPAQSTVPQDS